MVVAARHVFLNEPLTCARAITGWLKTARSLKVVLQLTFIPNPEMVKLMPSKE